MTGSFLQLVPWSAIAKSFWRARTITWALLLIRASLRLGKMHWLNLVQALLVRALPMAHLLYTANWNVNWPAFLASNTASFSPLVIRQILACCLVLLGLMTRSSLMRIHILRFMMAALYQAQNLCVSATMMQRT